MKKKCRVSKIGHRGVTKSWANLGCEKAPSGDARGGFIKGKSSPPRVPLLGALWLYDLGGSRFGSRMSRYDI